MLQKAPCPSSPSPLLFSPFLIGPRINDNHQHKTPHNHPHSHPGNQHHTPSTSRKLAPHNPILALEIPPPTQYQHQDRNSEKSRAEGLAHLREVEGLVGRGRGGGDGSIEAEELRYGDADGGEGEGGAEPGEKGTFCFA